MITVILILIILIILLLATQIALQIKALKKTETKNQSTQKKSIEDFKLPNTFLLSKFEFWYNTELYPLKVSNKQITKKNIEDTYNLFLKDVLATGYKGILKDIEIKYFNKDPRALEIYIKQFFYNRIYQIDKSNEYSNINFNFNS